MMAAPHAEQDTAPRPGSPEASTRKADRLAAYIKHRDSGLTQSDAAGILGISDGTARKYEAARLAQVGVDKPTLKKRGMSRQQLTRHLESLLRDTNTPVQYHAAIAAQIASLNAWKGIGADAKPDRDWRPVTRLAETWARETGREMSARRQCDRCGHDETTCAGTAPVASGETRAATDETDRTPGTPPIETRP